MVNIINIFNNIFFKVKNKRIKMLSYLKTNKTTFMLKKIQIKK